MDEQMQAANLPLLEHVPTALTVYVPPGDARDLADVERGVRRELNRHLLRYMEDQDAVLLAYRNLRLTTGGGSSSRGGAAGGGAGAGGPAAVVLLPLSPYQHYLTVAAAAELVLFAPRVGRTLVGRVHKLSPSLLGLLVLGGINASIAASDLPEGWTFDVDRECWVPPGGDYRRAVVMGDLVACRVTSRPVVDEGGGTDTLYTLDATLRPPPHVPGVPVAAGRLGLCARQAPEQDARRVALAAAAAADAAAAAAAAAAGGGGAKAGRQKGKSKGQQQKQQQKQATPKQQQQQQQLPQQPLANGVPAVAANGGGGGSNGGGGGSASKAARVAAKAARHEAREAKRAAKVERQRAREEKKEERKRRHGGDEEGGSRKKKHKAAVNGGGA